VGWLLGCKQSSLLGVWNALQDRFALLVEEHVFVSVEPEPETSLLYQETMEKLLAFLGAVIEGFLLGEVIIEVGKCLVRPFEASSYLPSALFFSSSFSSSRL
jgi:hypothetical protein